MHKHLPHFILVDCACLEENGAGKIASPRHTRYDVPETLGSSASFGFLSGMLF